MIAMVHCLSLEAVVNCATSQGVSPWPIRLLPTLAVNITGRVPYEGASRFFKKETQTWKN